MYVRMCLCTCVCALRKLGLSEMNPPPPPKSNTQLCAFKEAWAIRDVKSRACVQSIIKQQAEPGNYVDSELYTLRLSTVDYACTMHHCVSHMRAAFNCMD